MRPDNLGWRLVLSGPGARIPRKRKKDLKDSYLSLVGAVAAHNAGARPSDRAWWRGWRRYARQLRFRFERALSRSEGVGR
jgi:hypothetical protein